MLPIDYDNNINVDYNFKQVDEQLMKQTDKNQYHMMADFGTVTYNKELYSVKDLIVNSPSNHMIMGKSFDMELQINCIKHNSKDKITLVALFQAYDKKHSEFLSKLGFSNDKKNQKLDS